VAGQPAGMTKRAPGDILKIMQQRPFRGRGAVYRWLRENHQEVMQGFASTHAPWDTVVASMIRDGVTGQRGALPNRKAAAKVWDRVCRDIKADAIELRTGIPQHKVQPSRLPATWRPQAATPPPSRLGVAQPADGPAPATNAQDPTTDELIDGLRRVMLERSGR